jgi:TonB family protein
MTSSLPFADKAAPGVEVVLLTNDPELRETVMTAAGEERPVFPVHALSDALDIVGDRQPGVFVADMPSLGNSPHLTLQRLRAGSLDLIVLLAGSRSGDPALAELADSGEVFQVIPTPASVSQSRLSIQAAAQRHMELLMGKDAPVASPAENESMAPPPGDRRRVNLTAPVIGLGVAVVTYMLMPEQLLKNDAPGIEPAARSTASGLITRQPVPLDPTVIQLLDLGDAALAEGRLMGPEPDTAVASYLAAYELAPDEDRVQSGLDRVSDALAAQAASALMEGRQDDAAAHVDAALELRPESPQLAYLSRQIRQERARTLLEGAREAAEANDWQGTVVMLEEAALLTDGDLRAPTYAATEPFLARAEETLAAGNVARSQGILTQVAQVAPDHPRIAPLQRAINDAKAQQAAAARRQARAELAAREAEDQSARIDEQVQTLLAQAETSFAEQRLVGEGDDNALAQLREARSLKPGDPAVLDGFDRLTDALLGQADAAMESGNFESAERWIAEASVLGTAATRVAGARDRVEIARRAAVSNSVIPASELKRVAYVPPEYPGRAWRLGVEGWVDVEFDVTRQGETTAIIVVDTERKGYFEDAVREAIAQWQYEPRLYEGAPIDQRVRMRIEFERTLE